MNNKINERDKIELSSFWAYQKFKTGDTFIVNNKKFRVVDNFHSEHNQNKNGSLDAMTFELLNNNKDTGQQFIAFQGTDNTEKLNPNNPFKAFLADDWLENLKLMNNKNKTTPLLKQSNEYIEDYNQKVKDAKILNSIEFYNKYHLDSTEFLNKTLVGIGGNSQGGASAIYQGVQHRNIPITSTNGAMLPLSTYDHLGVPFYKNIIRYNSNYDLLSWGQDTFAKYVPSKRVNVENGVPTLSGLVDSHLGYKREYNFKTGEHKNLPVHTVTSVKDVVLKNGKYVPSTIKIMIEMDDRIPINVWTGDAIAVSGNSGLIKLNIENLKNLANMVSGEMSTMLQECVTFLNESYNISEFENSQFDERKYKLEEHFKKEIKLNEIEGWLMTYKDKSKNVKDIVSRLSDKIQLLRLIPHPLQIPGIAELYTIESLSDLIEKDTLRLISVIYDNLNEKIRTIFKNIDHDMKDGVPEEIMEHLKSVKYSILQIKNQNDIYGQQISECINAMQLKDATVMEGDLSIPNIGTHMVSETIATSSYMTRKMSILKDHIDNGVKEISEYIQEIYNEYVTPLTNKINEILPSISSLMESIEHLIDELNTPLVKALSVKAKIPLATIIDLLIETQNTLRSLRIVLNDSKHISPILNKHLEKIIINTKPVLVQAMFISSHYDDMFILNKQSQARLDQMAKQLQVVVNGLNENEGAAIRALDTSAATIQNNLELINQDLTKLSLY